MRSAVAGLETSTARILIVDDEPSMLRYIASVFDQKEYTVQTAGGGLEAMQKVKSGFIPDVVLLDLVMPDQDGITTLRQLREAVPGTAVIMLSCISDTQCVVEAMRLGAHDYLTKPFAPAALENIITECLQNRRADEPALPVHSMDELADGLCFIAASSAMCKLRERAELVAGANIPVLILGESGTGKEVVARLLHKLSPRANRTFLKVNCAAMPSELLESELFGYEPGAFTGANTSKPGKFEQCERGTILLDEIGEMPPAFQAKLLQVLQDHSFSRLGGRKVVKVDVRVFAATNINVAEALANKRLREDLYYRLNGVTLLLPPLRDRREEIPVLLKHYMGHYAERYACSPIALSPRLLEACISHPWPGNVRELCNFVKRALVLRDETAMLRELRENAAHVGAQRG